LFKKKSNKLNLVLLLSAFLLVFLVTVLLSYVNKVETERFSVKKASRINSSSIEEGCYLSLKIRQNCLAVVGEASSSCCTEIRPFVIWVFVPKVFFESVEIGDDLLEKQTPYLIIPKKIAVGSIVIVDKVESR